MTTNLKLFLFSAPAAAPQAAPAPAAAPPPAQVGVIFIIYADARYEDIHHNH